MIARRPPYPSLLPTVSTLLLAMFGIALGYGIALPILPFLIERLDRIADPRSWSRHTGLLTAIYALALFLFAPLWGGLSDRWGRRPTLLVGLAGFTATMGLFALAGDLLLLYVGRFLSGLFASAVAPVAYAMVGDYAPSKEWRAHRFALLNIAGMLGFFSGPLLGGLAVRAGKSLVAGIDEQSTFAIPFLAASAVCFVAAFAAWAFLHDVPKRRVEKTETVDTHLHQAVLSRLLAVSFGTAAAVGVFEVGMALRGKEVLAMDAASIGMMFAECSIIMFVAQAIVFSPFVKPEWTRYVISPSLAILTIGLITAPLAASHIAVMLSVVIVAASAGILSPIVTYWISLSAVKRQGAELGWQTAAASLGQAIGSAAGGLLFHFSLVPNAPFTLIAIVVFAGFILSLRLSHMLTGATKAMAA
jgi:MFS family permease